MERVKDDAAKALFDRAFSAFLVEERDNIMNGTAERNLAANLGFIMRQLKDGFGFGAYYVDPEYNRMQDRRVKLILDEDLVEVPIQCDLLLHGRGTQGWKENIIAIEMKKTGRRPEETVKDQRRLRALTTPPPPHAEIWSADGKTFPEYVCGYQLGILIELNIKRALYRLEEYRGGKLVATRGGTF